MQTTKAYTGTQENLLSTHRVLRNTYALLAATLLFSGMMAALSMAIAPPPMTGLLTFGAAFVLIMFVLPKTQDSAAGIGVVFLLTGLLGFGLGPMLNHYASVPGGSSIIATAMGGTGVIFFALSGYVLTTKKDFSFMGGMLFVGLIVVFGAAIMSMFFASQAFSLAVSAAIILLMSGFILFDTSRIINGGETNYIRATVSMFLNIFNLFTSLLQLLGIMSDD